MRVPCSWALPGVLLVALLFRASGSAASAFAAFTPSGNTTTHPAEADGRATPTPAINALELNGEGIRIDGRLDEAAWGKAEAGKGFRVWDPDRGALPTEETVFKVAYDTDAVYFAVACLERDPTKVSSKLARRDRFSNSDLVSVYIDPYLDRTTGYNFKVNPRGVQMDAYMFNDGDRDDDWDAVWSAETFQDEAGWYTEIRIPFSSIRYRPQESMTWGLQVYRYMHGRGEDTAWVTWDRETRGFISRFGELRGLRGVPPPRQIELLPYFLQSTVDPVADPAFDKLDNLQNAGLDLKYGVTADLTLNATIQPDFGQVEADPAELNLTPFETQFEEKRPFFIEGSRFFEHPGFNMFYSRRIGTGDRDARIRFAGKLTGKAAGSLSLAALVASTDIAEHGKAHNPFAGGERNTHYFIGRIGKEFKDGNHRFNLMQTAVNKSADRDEYSNFQSREAYTTGADFELNFRDRTYNVLGTFVGSAIDPEASGADPSASAATRYGTGGSLEFRKLGGKIQGGLWGRWEHDQLDLNDVGFLSAPDEIEGGYWSSWLYNPEGKSEVFNRVRLNFNSWRSWMYAGRTGFDVSTGDPVWFYGDRFPQGGGVNVNGNTQFRNYWSAWMGLEFMPAANLRYETRGGPLIKEPQTSGGWWGFGTDYRKGLVFEHEGNYYWDVEGNAQLRFWESLQWNQSSALNHSIGVGFTDRRDDTQYLETVNLAGRPGGQGIGGLAYVFGDIHQQTLDVTLRSSVLFSRNKSLELYVQPFMTVGDFRDARELARPVSYDFIPYAEPGYRAENFDFNYSAVNLNAVYRWEYRPGSTLYLVWTHGRESFDQRGHGSPGFHGDLTTKGLFENEPENRVLAKLNYWFSI